MVAGSGRCRTSPVEPSSGSRFLHSAPIPLRFVRHRPDTRRAPSSARVVRNPFLGYLSRMRFATIAEEHPPFEFRSPHGVKRMECQSRYWNGIAVRHVVQYLGPGRVWHDLSCKDPTAAILLEQVGGYCDSRLNVNRPTPRTRFDADHTVFVPTKTSVFGYSDGIE